MSYANILKNRIDVEKYRRIQEEKENKIRNESLKEIYDELFPYLDPLSEYNVGQFINTTENKLSLYEYRNYYNKFSNFGEGFALVSFEDFISLFDYFLETNKSLFLKINIDMIFEEDPTSPNLSDEDKNTLTNIRNVIENFIELVYIPSPTLNDLEIAIVFSRITTRIIDLLFRDIHFLRVFY